jgi:hypothetical protein
MIEEAIPHQDFQPDPQNIGSRTILDEPQEPPRKPQGLEKGTRGPQDVPKDLQNLQSEKEDDKKEERPETYDDYLIITEEENSDESVALGNSEVSNIITDDREGAVIASDVNSDADGRDIAAINRGIESSIKDREASDEAGVTEAIDEEIMPQNSDEDNSDDIGSEASTEASGSEANTLSREVPLEDTREIEDSLEVVGNRVGSFNSAEVK